VCAGRRRKRKSHKSSNSSNNFTTTDIAEVDGVEPGRPVDFTTPPQGQTQSVVGAPLNGLEPGVVVVKQTPKGKWRERRGAARAFVNTVESTNVDPSTVLVTDSDINFLNDDFQRWKGPKYKCKTK
jgi:hypothetical protein